MKEGWKDMTLAEICHSIEDGDWIEKKDQSNSGIRLIQTGNVGVGVYKDKIDKAKYISEETFVRLKCLEVVEGDVLISRLPEPVGRACIVPKLPVKSITAVDCSILKLKDCVTKSWFIYYTQSNDYFSKAKKECSGTTRDRITRKKLSVITIPVPPLSEQQRIVSLLDAEFAKIDTLKANAERNLQNAKDLFQAALKKELEPKEGWKIQTLKEVSAEMFAGGDAPKDNMSKDITPKYQVPIYANAVENDGLYGFTDIARVRKPSITIAGRGSGTGYVMERNEAYLPIVRLIVVLPIVQIVGNRYLYYAIRSLNIKPNGSAIPQLTIPMIANYPIPYPSIEKQSQIIARLDTLNEHCKTLQANYEKTIALCDDLKQALLRKAFNGET